MLQYQLRRLLPVVVEGVLNNTPVFVGICAPPWRPVCDLLAVLRAAVADDDDCKFPFMPSIHT